MSTSQHQAKPSASNRDSPPGFGHYLAGCVIFIGLCAAALWFLIVPLLGIWQGTQLTAMDWLLDDRRDDSLFAVWVRGWDGARGVEQSMLFMVRALGVTIETALRVLLAVLVCRMAWVWGAMVTKR